IDDPVHNFVAHSATAIQRLFGRLAIRPFFVPRRILDGNNPKTLARVVAFTRPRRRSRPRLLLSCG
ncbi:MAG: hypothetical protein L0312_00265, partial [Acidobacteria bacterium]|nr:hypothetical protein [Acidobacteriota bacterium]